MLNKRLFELREEKGLNQSDVANAVGISYISVGNYENATRIPKADVVAKLADFFDVSSDYLLGRTNIRKPEELNSTVLWLLDHEEFSEDIKELLEQLEKLISFLDIEFEKASEASIEDEEYSHEEIIDAHYYRVSHLSLKLRDLAISTINRIHVKGLDDYSKCLEALKSKLKEQYYEE